MNKILLAVSVAINSVLVMVVTGVIPFLLFASVVLNIGCVWYILSSISARKKMVEDVDTLLETVFELENHIKSIYEMEMFYGDETLGALIKHTKEVVDDIEFYRQKYSFDEESRIVEEANEKEEKE